MAKQMQDPVQRHPTRAEQLDILTDVIADHCSAGERVLDLGIGTGFVARMLLDKRGDIELVGVDINPESLTRAQENLAQHHDRVTLVEGDLGRVQGMTLTPGPYRAIWSALTFHDLDDRAKQTVIGRVATLLASDGIFLLYDRVRLTSPETFSMQQSIWSRIERVHGAGMRDASNFDSYLADLGSDNRPATLADYFAWFESARLRAQLLHLHGNVALFGAAPFAD